MQTARLQNRRKGEDAPSRPTIGGSSQPERHSWLNVFRTYLSPTRISQPAAPRGKAAQALDRTSLQRLVRLFAAWKGFLLVVALLAPGPGYDTSTGVQFAQYHHGVRTSVIGQAVEYFALRLTRWDALYFATTSARGHLYEQEWAFSWLYSHTTSRVANVLLWPFPSTAVVKHALAGILVSHISHLLAAITLYSLIYSLVPSSDIRKRQLAFATACLHIFSPAGLFLSAPYGEATFAFASFLGCLCYVKAAENRHHTFADAYQLDACLTIAAGLCFGLATMLRTNGLLYGIIFAWDVILTLPRLRYILRNRDLEEITRLSATFIAGTLIAVGFALPQAVAYQEYCTAGKSRPWCTALTPSIYSFVQKEYWNVGFMRYWTPNNIPLFFLAAPVAFLMIATAVSAIRNVNLLYSAVFDMESQQAQTPATITREKKVFEHVLPRFAVPQLVLVLMAVTSFHVQILNRISSGYVVWYFLLAIRIKREDDAGAANKVDDKFLTTSVAGLVGLDGVRVEWLVRAMTMYAVVQGGLYACFMPPA